MGQSRDKAKGPNSGLAHACTAHYYQGKSSSDWWLPCLNLGIKAAHPRWGGERALWSF